MTDRLSRRSFLHYGATAVTGSVMVRAVGAQHAAPLPVHTDFELEEATVAQLQDSMRTGARTSRSICVAYLARIAQLDPQLHSVLETNPDALAIGTALGARACGPGAAGSAVGVSPREGRRAGRGIIPIGPGRVRPGPWARAGAAAGALPGFLTAGGWGTRLNPAGLRGARIGVA